jgi:hypothetical protein
MELCGVLLEAAIAQLLMMEAVLDDMEGMLDHRPHLCERPLNRFRQIPRRLRQRLDDAALDRDVPQPAPAQAGETSRSASSGRLSAPLEPASPNTASSPPCKSAAIRVMSASLAAVPVIV